MKNVTKKKISLKFSDVFAELNKKYGIKGSDEEQKVKNNIEVDERAHDVLNNFDLQDYNDIYLDGR